MNFDEGFRRVGLVLGFLGAAAGFTLAFIYGSDLLDVHARAINFQTMAATYWRVVREHPLILLPLGRANQQARQLKEVLTPEEMGLGPHFESKTPDVPLIVDDGSLKRQNKALNDNGIDSAHVDNGRILSIHTTDDKTIFAAEPSFWSWLALPAFPLVGFLLPWGTIRIIIWIKRGFSARKT